MLLIPIPKTAVNTSEKLEKDTMPLGRCWSSARLELSASSAAAFSLSPSPSLLPQLLCLPTGSSQQALLASTTLPTPLGSNLPICQTWCEFRLGLPSAFFAQPKSNKFNKLLLTIHMAFQPPANRQKKNTWLSSHRPTETKRMAFQPQPSRNKKHGFPAAALYRNKTHGFPATNLQKQNTWHSSYQQTDRNKTHGFPATSSRNSSFFFPKKVWLKSMENACLEAFGCPASAKFKGSGPQFLLFSQDRHHSEACPSASSQLSHSSSHP